MNKKRRGARDGKSRHAEEAMADASDVARDSRAPPPPRVPPPLRAALTHTVEG